MNAQPPRAHDLGIACCLECGLLQREPPSKGRHHCVRCGRAINVRKRDSLRRAWAFLISAAILYIPANLLPIMRTDRLTEHRSDTILSGVVFLWQGGSWDLATIVFVASIVVPVLKICALTYTLWTSQKGHQTGRPFRTRLFHFTEIIGHWSMLDVFVVALLVTLVKFGTFADIEPLSGVVAFAGVVILTMMASASFDPRHIWDAPEVQQRYSREYRVFSLRLPLVGDALRDPRRGSASKGQRP